MDAYGFESVKDLPGQREGLFFWPALIGGIASLAGGAAKKSPEQALQYPFLKKNPIISLALIRSMLNAPTYDWSNLPSAPAVPGAPDFARTLANARRSV